MAVPPVYKGDPFSCTLMSDTHQKVDGSHSWGGGGGGRLGRCGVVTICFVWNASFAHELMCMCIHGVLCSVHTSFFFN